MYYVGNLTALTHNTYEGKTGNEILQLKKGSIKNAPLPPGSPSWAEIGKMLWEDIVKGAKDRKIGYKTIKKLLTNGRFNK